LPALRDCWRQGCRPLHVCDSVVSAEEWPPEFPSVEHAGVTGSFLHSQDVVEPEGNAEVFAAVSPCRVVRHGGVFGVGYPCVEDGEITTCGNRESFNVHPLACHRCLERVRVARLQPTEPLSARERLARVRASMLHDKIPAVANTGPTIIPLRTCPALMARSCSSIIALAFFTLSPP